MKYAKNIHYDIILVINNNRYIIHVIYKTNMLCVQYN